MICLLHKITTQSIFIPCKCLGTSLYLFCLILHIAYYRVLYWFVGLHGFIFDCIFVVLHLAIKWNHGKTPLARKFAINLSIKKRGRCPFGLLGILGYCWVMLGIAVLFANVGYFWYFWVLFGNVWFMVGILVMLGLCWLLRYCTLGLCGVGRPKARGGH